MKMHRSFSIAGLGLGLGLTMALSLFACSGGSSEESPADGGTAAPDMTTLTTPGSGTGPANAFNHDDILGAIGDVFADGRQVAPEIGERMHACGKLQYATLGRILQTRGVNIASATTFSAGQLYSSGNLVIGVANYPARVSESDRNTTGGIVRLYDILIAAAEELLPDPTTDLLSKSSACAGVTLFKADNTCNPAGFGCFMGVPPTDAQIRLCNTMVSDPFDANILNRKRLAVAAMASPIFLCD
jgi:hypothetical protein